MLLPPWKLGGNHVREMMDAPTTPVIAETETRSPPFGPCAITVEAMACVTRAQVPDLPDAK